MMRTTLATCFVLLAASTAPAQFIEGGPTFQWIRPQQPSPMPNVLAPIMPQNDGIVPIPQPANNPQPIYNHLLQPVAQVPQGMPYQNDRFVPVYLQWTQEPIIEKRTTGSNDPERSRTRRMALGW